MMNRRQDERVKREIHRLCHQGLDVFAFIRRAKRLLHAAVPFDASCWLTVDPASVLVTGGLIDYPPELMPAFARNEFVDDDINKLVFLARQTAPVGVLRQTTEGHPERSPRYREILRPAGLESELRAVFRTESSVWGACGLYRQRGSPDFEPEEAALVDSVSSLLGAGIRRSLISAAAVTEAAAGDGPGLVVLSEDGCIEAISAAAKRWIAELDTSLRFDNRAAPACAILHVAGRAQAIAAGAASADAGPASTRILTTSGRWLLAHASVLEGQLPGRTAVILEAARPAEIAPLIVAAYGLSQRERQITELVLQGASTAEMASRLHLSPFTVQDHLKAIFEKTSVRSRRQLAARVFFDHHYPPVLREERSGARTFIAAPSRSGAGPPHAGRGRPRA